MEFVLNPIIGNGHPTPMVPAIIIAPAAARRKKRALPIRETTTPDASTGSQVYLRNANWKSLVLLELRISNWRYRTTLKTTRPMPRAKVGLERIVIVTEPSRRRALV